MAKKKISGLPAGSALNGTELVPIVQTGTTKRITTQDIANLGNASGVEGSGTIGTIAKFTASSTIGDSLLQENTNAVGLAVTPSAWNTSYRAFQLPFGTSLSGRTDTTETLLASNTFRGTDGAFKYFGTGSALSYFQTSGEHIWLNAPSGTAGNAITFVQRMTLTAAGNLGIGVAIPSYKLSIQGSAGIEASEEYFYFNSTYSIGNNARAKIRAVGAGGGSGYGGDLRFSSRASNNVWNEDVMTISNTANVGIGTDAPLGKLEIRGLQSASKNLLLNLSKFDYGATNFYQNYSNTFYSGGKSLEIEIEALPLLQLAVNNAGSVGKVIFPNGSVLLGTSTDTSGYKLQVKGLVRIIGDNTIINYGELDTNNVYFQSLDLAGSTAKGIVFFGTSEYMRIASSGNVLINTSTDVASSKLTINSTTQGVLVPRMTETQINNINLPATGLLAYNTTINHMCMFDGSVWKKLSMSNM